MTQEDFIRIIRDARQKTGMKQQDLADAAHTSKYTVCQFENGKGNVSLNTLCDMLTALNVELIPMDDDLRRKLDALSQIAKELQ